MQLSIFVLVVFYCLKGGKRVTREELQKENESKKEYLKSYISLKRRAKILEEEINELRLNEMLPCVQYDDMPHSHNIKDLSNYAAALDDKLQELYKLRYDKVTRYTEIMRKIEMMGDETEKDLLTLRYLKGMKWEDICVELNYSWKQIHRLHYKALNNFDYEGWIN